MTEPFEGPVVRDKRRIDPTTGQVREPAGAPAGDPLLSAFDDAAVGGPPAGDPPGDATADVTDEGSDDGFDARVAELTADVQRLSAEYANYRKRVERDRELVRETSVASALGELLPVLDDIERARDHGDLVGTFKSVAEQLEQVVGRLGLERFGTAGEVFDPTVHEALMHSYSDDVDEPTATTVLQPGYRFAGRVVRPARVAVTEPGGDASADPTGGATS